MEEDTKAKPPRGTFVRLKEVPEGYKRENDSSALLALLLPRVQDNEFLLGFLKDMSTKEVRFGTSPKQEALLSKIEYTFLDDIKNQKKKAFGGESSFEGLSDEEIPF